MEHVKIAKTILTQTHQENNVLPIFVDLLIIQAQMDYVKLANHTNIKTKLARLVLSTSVQFSNSLRLQVNALLVQNTLTRMNQKKGVLQIPAQRGKYCKLMELAKNAKILLIQTLMEKFVFQTPVRVIKYFKVLESVLHAMNISIQMKLVESACKTCVIADKFYK